jgi:hypothetical protein
MGCGLDGLLAGKREPRRRWDWRFTEWQLAAADLKQAGNSGGWEESINGLCLECFKDPGWVRNDFAVLILENEKSPSRSFSRVWEIRL